uniref:Uncharacterized protein n=1 Tax=Anguilla anguilla TaxID=7936 RepID=A0A0E9XQ43_ANGAN
MVYELQTPIIRCNAHCGAVPIHTPTCATT